MKNDTVWTYTPAITDSWVFKQLVRRSMLQPQVTWNLGDSSSTLLWLDPWLQGKFLTELVDERLISYLGKGHHCMVAEIVDEGWKLKGRLLIPLKQTLDQVAPPTNELDLILMNGLKEPRLKHFWRVVRRKEKTGNMELETSSPSPFHSGFKMFPQQNSLP